MDSTFRSLRGMLGLTIATGALLLALPAVAAADTFTVNDDDVPGDAGPGGTCGLREFTTIGDAVNLANPDDVIRVCAGTYNESVFSPPEVTFLGAQAGVDARDRSVPASEESTVTVDDVDGIFALDSSEDVTVDGFTIAVNPSGPGVLTAAGNEIVNNVIADSDGGIEGDGVGTTVRRNRFDDGSFGIVFDEADGSEIDDNLFEGPTGFAATIVGGLVGDAGEDITITDNVSNSGGGIGVLNGFDVQIARNTIVDSPSSEVGGILIASSASVDVTRNVVDDPGEFIGAVTLADIDGPNFFVDITRNTFLGDGDEAGILMLPFAHEGTVDAHYNRIAGNDVGIVVEEGNFVDATNNWWGCNEGPDDAACDDLSIDIAADAVFDPWLTISASADPTSTPSSGGTSQISADLLTNTDGESVQPDFPDGTQVDFATDLGSVDPLFALTDEAVATTTLTAGDETGTANVEATLDNETVSTQVEFTEESEPPACTERIDGTPRKDNLTGTDGSELIRGRGGADKVNGLGEDDCVKGGSGPDKVVGGPGEDRVRGGAGDDKVKTRDGESDVVRCGAGDDTAKVDGSDSVKGCEDVKRG